MEIEAASMGENFPFGAPVNTVVREPSEAKPLFLLGAYPSALHVRWMPPASTGLKAVRALAVDNEPETFWDGTNESALVQAWAERWFGDAFGDVRAAGRLNGSSGRWVNANVLEPMSAGRDEVWFTDCLETYRASQGQAGRIGDTYSLFASDTGLPTAQLRQHPDEAAIVREALGTQRERLLRELEVVAPQMVITLGNAAGRVFHALCDLDGRFELTEEGYGTISHVSCLERPVQWLALAHPGAPAKWQETHRHWVEDQDDAFSSDDESGATNRLPRWLPQQLLAAGSQAPELLAQYVSKRLVRGARERARRRAANSDDLDEVVNRAIRSHLQLARSEGALAGLTMTAAQITTVFGSAGTLTLPAAVTTLATDLTTLAWLQCRMVLEIAALRDDPLDDPDEVAKELLILWGIHSPTRQIGYATAKAGQRVGKRLLERYLRGAALSSITSMFRVVGIRFSRAALIRGLPLVNVPINAAVNDVSTRALAKKADSYYRKKNGPPPRPAPES